jgi:hypothetical protein
MLLLSSPSVYLHLLVSAFYEAFTVQGRDLHGRQDMMWVGCGNAPFPTLLHMVYLAGAVSVHSHAHWSRVFPCECSVCHVWSAIVIGAVIG